MQHLGITTNYILFIYLFLIFLVKVFLDCLFAIKLYMESSNIQEPFGVIWDTMYKNSFAEKNLVYNGNRLVKWFL